MPHPTDQRKMVKDTRKKEGDCNFPESRSETKPNNSGQQEEISAFRRVPRRLSKEQEKISARRGNQWNPNLSQKVQKIKFSSR